MLESPLQRKIVKRLREEGGFWQVYHGSPFTRKGMPDIFGCYLGRFISLEVKRPGGELTPLQASTIRKIKAAGGIAGVVTSVEQALAYLAMVTAGPKGDSTDLRSVTSVRRTSRPALDIGE